MLYTNVVDRNGQDPWRVLTRSALLSLAVLVGVVAYEANATQMPAQKDEPKKDEPRTPVNPFVLPGLDLHDLLQGPNGLDEKQLEQFQQQLFDRLNQDMRRMMERQGRVDPNLLQGFPVAPGWRQGRGAGRDIGSNVRLGVRVAHPSDVLVDQLDLPQGQGLVIEQLTTDSAAAKAGVKVNDILLELNGKPVSDNPEEFARQLADIKANSPVEAVVLRKGRKEMVKGLTLPAEPRAELPQPGVQPPMLRIPNLNVNPSVGGAAGPDGTSVSISRSNDQFTARQQQGGEVVTITGRVADGKAIVDEVVIGEGRKSTRYDGIDKVPEAQRATAQKLADMAAKGDVRIERGGR